jgi:hypothetical protein
MARTLQQALTAFAVDNPVYGVRSYIGRGMGSRECVGLDTDDVIGAIGEFGAWLIDTQVDNAADIMRQVAEARSASMGLGYILYWPRVEWVVPVQPVPSGCDNPDCTGCNCGGPQSVPMPSMIPGHSCGDCEDGSCGIGRW